LQKERFVQAILRRCIAHPHIKRDVTGLRLMKDIFGPYEE